MFLKLSFATSFNLSIPYFSFIKLLKEISKNGNQTVIIVTHNANIQYMADRVIKLSDGKIIEDVRNDTPKDVEEIVW